MPYEYVFQTFSKNDLFVDAKILYVWTIYDLLLQNTI
jgi:hypothetical protein